MSDKLTASIFQFIEQTHFAGKKEMVDKVSEILNLQKSTVYKKIKGESTLSPDEIAILGKNFQFSIDEILGFHHDRIYFDFPALNGEVNDVIDYLRPIHQNLLKARLLNPLIYYTSREIPIFYYYSSPRLSAFKFHVFYNINWRDDKFKMTSYDFNMYENFPDFKSLLKSIVSDYMSLDSIEIWNVSVVDSTLNQIRYFLEADLMCNPQEAILLHDELLNIIEKLIQCVEKSTKETFIPGSIYTGNLQLYNNEIAFTGNLIYLKSETINTVYTTFDNPNFLNSVNPRLCEYTDKWLQRIINNSIHITRGNVRDKSQFFNRIIEKVEKSKRLVQNWIELNNENRMV